MHGGKEGHCRRQDRGTLLSKKSHRVTARERVWLVQGVEVPHVAVDPSEKVGGAVKDFIQEASLMRGAVSGGEWGRRRGREPFSAGENRAVRIVAP